MAHLNLRPGDKVRLCGDTFRGPTTARIVFRELTDEGSVLYCVETELGLQYGAWPHEIVEVLSE